MINIVCFNGGRGAATLISSLLETPNTKLTSIVNAYDDGKSTGAIRHFFDMLGPSDIRKVQQLMLPNDDQDFKNNFWLFDFRFPKNSINSDVESSLLKEIKSSKETFYGKNFYNKKLLGDIKEYLSIFLKNIRLIQKGKNLQKFSFKDCSLMNCIYAGAFIKHDRNIENATLAIEKLFNLTASVLPNTIENKKLMGIRKNGVFLYDESEIVELRSNVSVERIYLLDEYLKKKHFSKLSKTEKLNFLTSHQSYVEATQRSTRAIKDADIIIYAPGTQHSSLYPTYLSRGITSSIADNYNAKKVFITNIGADYETPKYFADDYIYGAFKYLKLSESRPYQLDQLFSNILINKPKTKDAKRYVQIRPEKLKNISALISVGNFESDKNPGKHCGSKLAKKILEIYS
jgi:2-phospho-L-lactate transferase/gluconeogenesis factor (CofD/UPF0052 family)